MTSSKEHILVRELRKGNASAYELLFKEYNRKLYHFSMYFLKEKEEAKGIVQEVFLQVWHHRHDLNPDKSFGGYIFKIARNIIYNQLKKNIQKEYYREFLKGSWNEGSNDTEKTINNHELTEVLNEAIETLPPKRKEIFLMNRSNGLTMKEIADKLNISVNTVDSQIQRSLKYLRENLRKYYETIIIIIAYVISWW
jgi:RNA polymerase sigma-70 factor (family 1)